MDDFEHLTPELAADPLLMTLELGDYGMLKADCMLIKGIYNKEAEMPNPSPSYLSPTPKSICHQGS